MNFREETFDGEGKPLAATLTKIARCHDFTVGTEESQISLEVPFHVTPTFQARTCRLSWLLHFEFVSSLGDEDDGGRTEARRKSTGGEVVEWNAPQKIKVQTLKWNLPIVVFPADPSQVCWRQKKSTRWRKTVQIS